RPPAEKAIGVCQQSRSRDDKHVSSFECPEGVKPPIKFAWYPDENLPQQSNDWVWEIPGFDHYPANRNSFDATSCRQSLGEAANAGHLCLCQEAAKVVKH